MGNVTKAEYKTYNELWETSVNQLVLTIEIDLQYNNFI